MLLIPCPWCGPREETEFSYGGEAHITRPKDPDKLSDEKWADYLYMRSNSRGRHAERWVHTHGCRRWFNIVRDTVRDEILVTYKMGETPATAKEPAAQAPCDGGAAKKKSPAKTPVKRAARRKTGAANASRAKRAGAKPAAGKGAGGGKA